MLQCSCVLLLAIALCVPVLGQFFNNRPYPTYSLEHMPDTSFSCRDKILGGYYADPETQCQMFHVCVKVAGVGVQDFRFLCPNGTAFDQDSQICADWDDVDCEAATLYYSSDNFDLYRIGSGFESKSAAFNGEDEAAFHLQRADTGDVRLHRENQVNQKAEYQGRSKSSERDIFRGSSSSNFFNNQNGGKEDDYDTSGDVTGSHRNSVPKDQKVHKKLIRRPVPTTTTTTTTTVAPPPSSTVQRTYYDQQQATTFKPSGFKRTQFRQFSNTYNSPTTAKPTSTTNAISHEQYTTAISNYRARQLGGQQRGSNRGRQQANTQSTPPSTAPNVQQQNIRSRPLSQYTPNAQYDNKQSTQYRNDFVSSTTPYYTAQNNYNRQTTQKTVTFSPNTFSTPAPFAPNYNANTNNYNGNYDNQNNGASSNTQNTRPVATSTTAAQYNNYDAQKQTTQNQYFNPSSGNTPNKQPAAKTTTTTTVTTAPPAAATNFYTNQPPTNNFYSKTTADVTQGQNQNTPNYYNNDGGSTKAKTIAPINSNNNNYNQQGQTTLNNNYYNNGNTKSVPTVAPPVNYNNNQNGNYYNNAQNAASTGGNFNTKPVATSTSTAQYSTNYDIQKQTTQNAFYNAYKDAKTTTTEKYSTNYDAGLYTQSYTKVNKQQNASPTSTNRTPSPFNRTASVQNTFPTTNSYEHRNTNTYQRNNQGQYFNDNGQYDDGQYRPEADKEQHPTTYNPKSRGGQEDEFLKTAHSINFGSGRNNYNQRQTATEKQVYDSPRPFATAKKTSPPPTSTTIRSPPSSSTSKAASGSPAVNKKSTQDKGSNNYDYAYYDNDSHFADYDNIGTEFAKTSQRN